MPILSKSKKHLRKTGSLGRKPLVKNLHDQADEDELMEVRPAIVVLTTFPPRECGIATYSNDLIGHLNTLFSSSFDIRICAVLEEDSINERVDKDSVVLNTDSEASFDDLATKINRDPSISMLLIQHEFGLFHQNKMKFLELVKSIKKPVVIGFHTVLPHPDEEFRNYVVSLCQEVDHIIVMTKTSKNILVRDYDCNENNISVISHGTHLIAHESKEELKEKFGYSNRTVLSNFGLLGPGKGIETTLNALPELVNEFPDLLYLIIGKTHPGNVKQHGESYRDFLKEKIHSLKLEQHVSFINEFVPLDNLLEYLQLTDIYVFTSKDPNQAVSGTFSYAMSCGCPIVSTPIPHAKEFLKENNGLLFDFGDSKMLVSQLKILLNDKVYRENLGLNCLHASASNAWENSGLAHAELFNMLDPKIKLKFNLPELRLDYLKKMTTNLGMLQFAVLNRPDLESGYTLDDNARALIVTCKAYKREEDDSLNALLFTYINFILNCQRYDGRFLNYVDKNEAFTRQNHEVNLEDSNGRAIWALGELLAIKSELGSEFDYILFKVEDAINQFLSHLDELKSPRAMAFVIKGLYHANLSLNRKEIKKCIETLGNKLADFYNRASDHEWKWFESYLTYGNAALPEAMLLAYKVTGNPEFEKIAKDSFQFLLDNVCSGPRFQVISNQAWFKKGDTHTELPLGGQQPIDVAYTILALKEFDNHYKNDAYKSYMTTAFSWFLGNNHLSQTVYNSCTKGCYDGIEADNVNLNQGAESLVSYLLSRLTIDEK